MKTIATIAAAAILATFTTGASAHQYTSTLPEVLKETVKGGEMVVSAKGGYEVRADDGKTGTLVSKENNGDGTLGAELQYQKGKYAVGLEFLDGSNAYHTKAYNLNGYRYFQPEILKGKAKPYAVLGVGHLETETHKVKDSTPTVSAGAGVKFLPSSVVSPKVEVRQVYGIDNRTQDTLILGALDLNLNKAYKALTK